MLKISDYVRLENSEYYFVGSSFGQNPNLRISWTFNGIFNNMSGLSLDFQADIVLNVDTGSKLNEYFYNFEVMVIW